MTRLTACSVVVAIAVVAGGDVAGAGPFIATVCDDSGRFSQLCAQRSLGIRSSCAFVQQGSMEPDCKVSLTAAEEIVTGTPSALQDFYLSAKEYQFTHANTDQAYAPSPDIPTFAHGETFLAPSPINREDPCDAVADAAGSGLNVAVGHVNNLAAHVSHELSGSFQWTIVLPERPESGLDIAIQCAVLKPQETDITFCAGEEGEFQGPGFCNQALLYPRRPTIMASALPMITAAAYPGYYTRAFNTWAPFRLTAFRAPSTLAFSASPAPPFTLVNGASMQLLDGSAAARIPLKACETEIIAVKQPVSGQVNAAGQVEHDLDAGDYIVVRMDLPRGHPMDVYCHAQSVRVQGIGDPLSLLD